MQWSISERQHSVDEGPVPQNPPGQLNFVGDGVGDGDGDGVGAGGAGPGLSEHEGHVSGHLRDVKSFLSAGFEIFELVNGAPLVVFHTQHGSPSSRPFD